MLCNSVELVDAKNHLLHLINSYMDRIVKHAVMKQLEDHDR